MNGNDLIIHGLTVSQMMLDRACNDLTADELLHRPTPIANCAAWIIGHLVLTDRGSLKRLAVPAEELPALPEGFEKKFSRDEGSPQATEFGDTSVLLPLFTTHRKMLLDAVRRATPEQLEKPAEPTRPMFSTLGEFLNFMAAHTSLHAGQITMIRRSLGKRPIV